MDSIFPVILLFFVLMAAVGLVYISQGSLQSNLPQFITSSSSNVTLVLGGIIGFIGLIGIAVFKAMS